MTSPSPSTPARSHVTTHVLDAARGRPAADVPVRLEAWRGSAWETLAEQQTDADGRCAQLGPAALDPGRYRLTFDTDAYFTGQAQEAFYPEVVVVFTIREADQHYHVPVLLSPFAYSTYRGS